jgi:arsenate reductase
MAEALLNELDGDRFEAESAGMNPTSILPVAAEAMREVGLDISDRPTRNVNEIRNSGYTYDFVITVCDEASAADCPVFKHPCQHLHWAFAEPSQFRGTEGDIIEQTREVRDQIRSKILRWINGINYHKSGDSSKS